VGSAGGTVMVIGAIPGAQAPSSGIAKMVAMGPRRRASRRRLISSVLLIAAGVLSAFSLTASWWSYSNAGAGGSSTSQFIPGTSTSIVTKGMTVSMSYADAGLGPVGALYLGLLVGGLILAAVALAAGAIALLATWGRVQNPARQVTLRNLLVGLTVAAIACVVAIPLAQPSLVNLSGSAWCPAGSTSATPCTSYWGASKVGSTSQSWGADTGWYLFLGAPVLLALSLLFWGTAAREPWGRALRAPGVRPASAAPGTPAVAARPPGSTDLDRLVRLRGLLDAGVLTVEEFELATNRALALPGTDPGASSTVGWEIPEAELRQLKSKHDAGTITDAEFAQMKRQLILGPPTGSP
jgi:putative oligomerization/nucleic acid binding protein